MRLLERRSAQVADGDACARVQRQQEDEPSSARLQSVSEQLPLIYRDPGEVNLTPGHTQIIKIQRKTPRHQDTVS